MGVVRADRGSCLRGFTAEEAAQSVGAHVEMAVRRRSSGKERLDQVQAGLAHSVTSFTSRLAAAKS
jgi:hypothetical protein